VTYSATGLPAAPNASGHHNAGANCNNCHDGSGATDVPPVPQWFFAGTVYKAGGTTGAPNVQVGVKDGNNLYTAYTGTNGNFFFGGTATINWATAKVMIRNANGEASMASAASASCNSCHRTGGAAGGKLIEP